MLYSCLLILAIFYEIKIYSIQIESVYNDPVESGWNGDPAWGTATPGCTLIPLNTKYRGPHGASRTDNFNQQFSCNHYSRVIISYTEAYGCGQNGADDGDWIRLYVNGNIEKENGVGSFIRSEYCNIAEQPPDRECGRFLIHDESVDIGYKNANEIFNVGFEYVFILYFVRAFMFLMFDITI